MLSQIIFRNVSVTEALVGSSGKKTVFFVGQPLWDPRPWVATHRGHRALWRAKQNLSTQLLLPDTCTPTPSPKTGSVPFSDDHLPWIPSFWGTISGSLCSVSWGNTESWRKWERVGLKLLLAGSPSDVGRSEPSSLDKQPSVCLPMRPLLSF